MPASQQTLDFHEVCFQVGMQYDGCCCCSVNVDWQRCVPAPVGLPPSYVIPHRPSTLPGLLFTTQYTDGAPVLRHVTFSVPGRSPSTCLQLHHARSCAYAVHRRRARAAQRDVQRARRLHGCAGGRHRQRQVDHPAPAVQVGWARVWRAAACWWLVWSYACCSGGLGQCGRLLVCGAAGALDLEHRSCNRLIYGISCWHCSGPP